MNTTISVKAGNFEVEFHSGGWPRWVRITYDGQTILQGLHHKEVQDLEYCLHRIRAELRRVTPEDRDVI